MDLKNLPWYGQVLVFLVVGAILLGIFYFVHYSPTQDVIAGIVKQSSSIEEDIRKAEMNRERLQKIEDELDNNKKTLQNLKQILPERGEVSDILKKVQAIASMARLRILSFTPKKEINKDIYTEWPIQITGESNYHNLAIFFDQVSRMKKIFNITGVQIKPLSIRVANQEFDINAAFTATTYIYREKAAQPAAGDKKRGIRKKAPAKEVTEEELS